MEEEPAREEHDLDRDEGHGAPRDLAKKGEGDAREDIALRGPPARQDGLAGTGHVRLFGQVPGKLQGIVRLDRAAHIEVPAVEQGPTAVPGLVPAQVHGDARLEGPVDLVHEVHHEDVLGRDGAVGLQLIDPVPVRLLVLEERLARARDGRLERLPPEPGDRHRHGPAAPNRCL